MCKHESGTAKHYGRATTKCNSILLARGKSTGMLSYDSTDLTMAKFRLSVNQGICKDSLVQETSFITTELRHSGKCRVGKVNPQTLHTLR